jgi:hypothetical protein
MAAVLTEASLRAQWKKKKNPIERNHMGLHLEKGIARRIKLLKPRQSFRITLYFDVEQFALTSILKHTPTSRTTTDREIT